jgi:glycosyltransferase involved in cell wall biosynthesis
MTGARRRTGVLGLGRRIARRIIKGPPPRRLADELGDARRVLDGGDVAAARALADGLYARSRTADVVRFRRDVYVRMGEVTEATRLLHELHGLDPDRAIRDRERLSLGRLIETTPGWLPRIPGPPRPVLPESDGAVLHLLKESRPYVTTGYAMRSAYNLRAAVAAGLVPSVVTSLGFPRRAEIDTFPDVDVVDGIDHHRLDLGPFYRLDRAPDQVLVDQAWLTAAVARRVRPAIIHASSGFRGYEQALVGAALRAHIGRPLVYEVRSFHESVWSRDEAWREVGEQYHRRLATEDHLMAAADHVITIGEAMRAEIVERGVPPERITILPNGVDADIFTPEQRDADLANRYGLAAAFTFGYVSNLDHYRENQELLVDATAILLGRGRRVRCLIVGDGARRAEVEAHARQSAAAAAVVFTGAVPHEDVRRHYALLDAFVVPRRDERAARMVTPLKPFEALAMGIPLVVADLPALREIAEPDARGLAFPAGDAAALAAALERLIDQPELRERLAREGRAWVARERSWSANGPLLRSAYEQATAAFAARARTSR